jgi:RHS repeat-associated protein
MADKQRISLVETRTLDAAGNDPAPRQLIRYQFGNHLGSASLELDDQAQIVSYEEYAPYGSSTYQAVRAQTETRKRYLHSGKERDNESGLYYYGARYYSTWLARWISPDPADTSHQGNRYGYVDANPIAYTDPNGLWSWPWEKPVEAQRGLQTKTLEATIIAKAHAGVAPQELQADIDAYEASRREDFFARKDTSTKSPDIRDFTRALAPTTFQNVRRNDPVASAKVPHGVEKLYARGAQDELAVKGANVAKKVVEYGGTAATIAGDIGLAGVQVGVQGIKSIGVNAVEKQLVKEATEQTVEEATVRASINIVERATEIHSQLATKLSKIAAEKTTVAVARSIVDGSERIVVAVNTRKAYDLLRTGVIALGKNEVLGHAPSVLNSWFRRVWGFTNRHAEELALRTAREAGAKGGEIATATASGCWRCQSIINRVNRLLNEKWVHLNPDPKVVPK